MRLKHSLRTKIGNREIKVCKAIGKPVIMEYIGVDEQPDLNPNGCIGWLCLHNDCPEDEAKDVADFLAGRNPTTPLWTK